MSTSLSTSERRLLRCVCRWSNFSSVSSCVVATQVSGLGTRVCPSKWALSIRRDRAMSLFLPKTAVSALSLSAKLAFVEEGRFSHTVKADPARCEGRRTCKRLSELGSTPAATFRRFAHWVKPLPSCL